MIYDNVRVEMNEVQYVDSPFCEGALRNAFPEGN